MIESDQANNSNSGDDMNFHHGGGLAHSAMYKRYSTGFDDPFAADAVAQFDQMPRDDSQSPSIDRDSKYLSFSMPQFPYALLNESFQRCSINIAAQLHGMFFLAESQWPTSVDTAPPPPELTCYRRNLFQITGSITLPRSLRYIFTEDGSRIPLYELELAVSATESVEGNTVKIISVPWKTPAGGETSKPEDKIEREPPTIPLDKMSGSDLDTDYTTFPFQWKRLQFRIATANNGRRKELQQHFTLHLKVMASLSTGGKFAIAEAHSGAVIVRGRSPRNFASRKDLPLSSSSTSRKHVPSLNRNSISQTSVPQITSAPKMQSPQEELPPSTLPLDSDDLTSSGLDIHSWQAQHPTSFPDPLPTPSYSVAMNPMATMPGFLGESSPEEQNQFSFAFSPTGLNNQDAMSLNFGSDDEGSPFKPQQQLSRRSSRPPTSNPSPSMMTKPRAGTVPNISPQLPSEPPKQRPRLHSQQMSSNNLAVSIPAGGPSPAPSNVAVQLSGKAERPPLTTNNSNIPFSPSGDSVDKLYEYFPLTVEDWMPPVDAVFRPHVVHHSGSHAAGLRSPVGRNSKRYFSEVA